MIVVLLEEQDALETQGQGLHLLIFPEAGSLFPSLELRAFQTHSCKPGTSGFVNATGTGLHSLGAQCIVSCAQKPDTCVRIHK